MNRKEIVQKTIHFQNPSRLARFWYEGHEEDSDIIKVHVRKWYDGPEGQEAELGFRWQKSKGDDMTMGVPDIYQLKDWDNFENYVKNILPDPYDQSRFIKMDTMEKDDHYYLADLYLTGFTGMWLLRSFDELFADMYDEPERVTQLCEVIFGFENEIIKQLPAHGFHGAFFCDDWGMQSTMMISPEMWRSLFKEHYRKQFALCHELGLDVFFHTCGYVYEIIPDLIEVGVDVLNLGQHNVNGIENLGRDFRGKICFCQPIDYQSVGLYGTKEEIYSEANALIQNLSDESGGLIAHFCDYEMSHYDAIPGNTMLTRNSFVDQDPYVKRL